MKKKFDAQTAKKLLSHYAEKVNFYMMENATLKSELEDAKTTLVINKELLYKHLSSSLKDKDKKIFATLKEENSRILKKNKELYDLKVELEKKLYIAQEQLDDAIMKNQEMIDKEKTESFQLGNSLIERNTIIAQLKKELDKYYREDFNSTKELIIGDPDKVNVEMNNELCETREIIGKYNRMLQDDKRKIEEQNKTIQNLKLKILNKKKQKKIKQNMENIELFGYILTSDEDNNNSQSETSNVDNFMNLESPIIKFPEKVKQPKYLATDISDSNQNVPKLDFSKVQLKYPPLRKIDVIEGIKGTSRSNDEFIDKIKFQLKVAKNLIIKYKNKNSQLKKLVVVLKQHCLSLKAQYSQSTKDEIQTSKKIQSGSNINNDSMNANTSIRDIENEDFNYEESDFNYIIKEYNRSVCVTSDNKESHIYK